MFVWPYTIFIQPLNHGSTRQQRVQVMTISNDFRDNAGVEEWAVKFFKEHIVVVAYTVQANSKPVNNKGIRDLRAVAGFNPSGMPGQAWTGWDDKGKEMEVVTLHNNLSNNDTFSAYWCPYKQANAPHVMLGSKASYMFTAKMDGCTFGIGHALANGDVYVAHANQNGDGAGQLAQLRGHAKFSNNPNMGGHRAGQTPPTPGVRADFGPASYRADKRDNSGHVLATSMATTFGVRAENGGNIEWKFYSQIYWWDLVRHKLKFESLVPIA
jgi:hypothetical protein